MTPMTLKRVLGLGDRLQAVIKQNHLDGLFVNENFLLTVAANWEPLLVKMKNDKRVPKSQLTYWRGVSWWIEQVESHPEWILEMDPFKSVRAQERACQQIYNHQAKLKNHWQGVDQIRLLQQTLSQFNLQTQSVGELAMIHQYWHATAN